MFTAIALIAVAGWLYQKDSNVLALICLAFGLLVGVSRALDLIEMVP